MTLYLTRALAVKQDTYTALIVQFALKEMIIAYSF